MQLHDILLPLTLFLTYTDAKSLRNINKRFLSLISGLSLYDPTTRIHCLHSWRVCFPHAQAANLANRDNLCDEELAHLAGIKFLNIHRCRNLTSAGLKLLPNSLEQLIMSECNQEALVDEGLAHLTELRVLDVSWCSQLTGAFLSPRFDRLQVLRIAGCRLMDDCFQHLTRLHTLDMRSTQHSDAALAHFSGSSALRSLDISLCPAVTDQGLRHLGGVSTLAAAGCGAVTSAGFAPLKSLTSLNISGCCQETLGDEALWHLPQLEVLNMNFASQVKVAGG